MGGKTMVVSLPSNWVKKYGLKKGEEVDLEERDRTLAISTDKNLSVRKTTLDVRLLKISGRRVMAALYKRGYDEIEVLYDKPQELEEIKKALSLEAMNFEIIKQTKDRCTIKSIAEATHEEFDNILRRTFLVLNSMLEEIHEGLIAQDKKKIEEAKEHEKTNNKFTHFCRRSLNKRGYKNYEITSIMYTIIEQLENVADELKFLCDFLISEDLKKLKISEDTNKLFNDVNAFTNHFYELFYNFDLEKAEKFTQERKKIIEIARELFMKKPNKEVKIIHHLMNTTQRIFEMLGPLLATKL